MQRGKMGKKKSEQSEYPNVETKWRHSTEAVEKGKVTYNCKFWGCVPVGESKGSELIKESIKKLQFANDIRKSEEGLKASKLKKVELCISTQNLVVTDVKSKTALYSFPLQRVSYCADDKTTKKLFGFIARDKEFPQHQCYILECEKNAEDLTLAVGQAFDLAYKRYKADQAAGGKDVTQMKKRAECAEKENELLRKKLEEMEKMNRKDASSTAVPSLASIANPPVSQVPENGQEFDPFAKSNNVSASSFEIQSPPPFPAESRPLPPGVSSNVFDAQPQGVHNESGGDLLGVFGIGAQSVITKSNDINEMFDPLAQTNGTSQTQQQMPTVSEEAQQNEHIYSSVSRPKPASLSSGLLPPPPTKQSIKEKNRNSNITGDQGTTAPVLESPAVLEMQNGVQNNLVIF